MTLISTTGFRNQNTASQGVLIENFLGGDYRLNLYPFGNLGLSASASGTGSLCSGTGGDSKIGILFSGTGTTTTGSAGFISGLGISVTNNTSILILETNMSIVTASDLTNAFSIFFGFANTRTSAFTDGVQFLIIGTGIQGICRNNTISTTTSIGTIPTSQWFNLKIILSAASCSFFVDNVLLGTITTNIPASKNLGISSFILKSAGTESRSYLLDNLRYTWLYR